MYFCIGTVYKVKVIFKIDDCKPTLSYEYSEYVYEKEI